MSDVIIKVNKTTMNQLTNAKDKIVYAVARATLDKVANTKAVAYRSGRTEGTMLENGVGQDSEGYFIGNFTNYATYPYHMSNVNWTNPQTKTRWFHTTWQEYGDIIEEECVRRYSLD